MRQMKIARQIRIQRLQDKNRMVGQTFNPSGITSKEIETREHTFVSEWRDKTLEERQVYWVKAMEMQENWEHSWPWQWCVFQRAFVGMLSQVVH